MVSDFKKNKKGRVWKKITLYLFGLIAVFLFIFLIVSDIKVYKKKQELSQQLKGLENKIEETKKKNEELKAGIKSAGNSDYIEKVAREELDLQKPGEKVVSFITPSPAPSPGNSESNGLLQYFFASFSNFWNWIVRAR